MLGVLANSLAVLIGGVIGMLFGSRIKSKYTDSLMVALGLATMGMGVVSTVGTTDVLCIIVCCPLEPNLLSAMRPGHGHRRAAAHR